MIQFTLENSSNDWVRIRSVTLLPHPQDKIQAVLGEDLQNWTEAKMYQSQLEENNTQAAMLGVYTLGMVAAAAGGGDMKLAGAGAMVGTAGWAVGHEVSRQVNGVEQASQIPATHLFAKTSVPTKMFQRRWLLLSKPVGETITQVAVNLITDDGKTETFTVRVD